MGAKQSVPSDAVPEGRTFIVTGANGGIGYYTSKKIAQLGGTVVMACRSEEKAKKAIEQMQEENRQEVRAKRRAEKEASEKEKQRAEAAAAKEEQEKKREEERKKKEEEQKKAKEEEEAKAKEGEAAKEGEEKPAEGGEAAAEGGETGATEEAAKEEETTPSAEENTTAEEGQGDAGKDSEEVEEGGEEAKVGDGGAAGDAPAEQEPEPEEEIPDLKLQFMQLDLESFESVASFVKQFKDSGLPLHVLICNGGLIAPALVTTKDGLESSFQINYLSHFLLTLHLLPLLKASGGTPKIVNVTSWVHSSAEGVNLENIQSQKGYKQAKAYANSKLYQIMNMYTLSSKVKESGIDIFSVHPGVIDSGFQKGYSGLSKVAMLFHKGFGKNAQDGAATTLTAVLDEQYNGKGPLYFSNCKPAQPSNMSKNEEKQATLWRYSLELLRDHVDDTILAEIGETLESIQPKEPEPTPEESAPDEGDKPKSEGESEKKEEEAPAAPSQDEEGKTEEGDKPAEETQQEEQKTEETEQKEEAGEEKKDEE